MDESPEGVAKREQLAVVLREENKVCCLCFAKLIARRRSRGNGRCGFSSCGSLCRRCRCCAAANQEVRARTVSLQQKGITRIAFALALVVQLSL